LQKLACPSWIFLTLACALASTAPAFAIPTLYPKLQDHEIRVGLTASSYLTGASEPSADQGTGNLGVTAGVRGVGGKQGFQVAVEGESLFGLRNSHYRYLDIGEIYAGYEDKTQPSRAFLYVGRKRYEWSTLDSYWGLGLFNPRFRWDYLNERENGLFGLFTGFDTELVQATAYISPLFIPEQGAPFDITGGNCVSSSPWFSCPTSSIRLFNQPVNVRYTLDVPPVKKLILHAGGGGTLRVGRQYGLFGRLSLARKPMNQFLLSFEGRLDLVSNEVPAVIRPRVLYHDLYSMDLGWASAGHGVTGSVIAERPVRDATPPTWNTQEPANGMLYGLTARTRPLAALPKTRFEAGYFHRDGGMAADRGPFVTPGVETFEPRYAFRNAFSLAVFTPVAEAWADCFQVSTKFLVDTVHDGNILIFDSFYRPLASLMLNLGLDVLGSESTSPVDFISRYQRNDRVRGGLAYVF
jgi:hypothetical protein